MVVTTKEDDTFYNIMDSSIPDSLNYKSCLIDGEKMTIIFQSGKLSGRQFDVKYINDDKKFEIVPAKLDGIEMPGSVFIPAVGDTYAVFGCMLPDAYINDSATQSGASWDMLREGVRYKYENEEPRYTFSGVLDELFAEANWLSIGGKIVLGGYVLLKSDKFVEPDGILIRMIGIRTPVNTPRRPVIELSNVAAPGSIISKLNEIKQDEVLVEQQIMQLRNETKRRYEDAKEAQEMLEQALDNFSPGINPIWVRTMSVLVGNEYQQFEFVNRKTEPQSEFIPHFNMDNSTKIFTVPASILKHMTMGIENTSSSHDVSKYKYWDVSVYTSPYLDSAGTPYYLVAKCVKSGTTGEFLLKEKYDYDPGDGYWYFLVGLLSSEREGERSYASAYGYTEILPGQMRIKMIISPNGDTYFNVSEGIIGGNIKIMSGSTGYQNLTDKPDLTVYSTKSEFSVLSDRI